MNARITADWLRAPALQAVFDALETDGDTARVVGGAVRNTLLGLPATDIDISTTAEPALVMEKAAAKGLKAVPTGFDHGTVTLVSAGTPYEVTTLREDVETHGRSATVRFGRNWQHDAERRDFTMNALYADRSGQVFDPVGGLPDLEARHVRFIGDPRLRIAEDYLRILRFFRFHAQYGAGDLDAAGFAAVIDLRDGLAGLSAERIGMEMRKLVAAPRAAETVLAMREAGIVSRVLATHGGLKPFQNLRALDALAPETRAPALALAVLSDGGEDDLDDMADHLRLSNAERKRMKAARAASDIPCGWGAARPAPVPDTEIRRLLFLAGREAAIDGMLHAWANAGTGPQDDLFADALTRLRDAEIPVFPLTGKDLVSAGVPAGPKVGEGLQKAQAAWIDSGFALDREALLAAAKAD
ncbi:CCA tRNA nucleotidyltransferase [Stappia stellulata]|uniref:CCA tRNA nucleotidyltransferase n=1 Tax=Stappia stellulata TaxID=71235 RepID=UPI000420DDFA|nr:CCA tRNA nucleotidyltransferase [Stappia stellulata]